MVNVKQRILSNWTFMRVIYLIIGCIVVIHSIIQQQWFGVAIGFYFAAMGLFGLGCAAGNCFGGSCDPKEK